MFTKTNVADVMKSFNKTITDLENVALFNEQEATRNDEIIVTAEYARNNALNETETARAIAENLRKLLDGNFTKAA